MRWRSVEHHLHTQAFSEKSLAQVKANPDTSHQLSILLPHGVPITLTAFLLLADARSDLNQRIQAKKAQTSGAHSTVAAQSSKRPQPSAKPPPPATSCQDDDGPCLQEGARAEGQNLSPLTRSSTGLRVIDVMVRLLVWLSAGRHIEKCQSGN